VLVRTSHRLTRSALTHAASLALLLALPLIALAALRLGAPLSLAATSPVAWLAPAAAGLVTLGAGAGMLLALIEGLRSGSAGSLLNAAGLGILAVTYALEALGGPGSSGWVPTAASAVGGLMAAVLLLAGTLLETLRVRIAGARGQVLSLIGLFVLVELAMGAVMLISSGGPRNPAEQSLRIVSVSLLALAAGWTAVRRRPFRAGPFAVLGMLAVGMLALLLARSGSADLLVALASLAVGIAIFIGVQLGVLRGPIHRPSAAAVLSDPPPDEPEPSDEARLTRELRGTIAELLRAQHTIELQRDELERAASVDQLTGIASRRTILERLRLETAQAWRYQHPFAVLLLDIDHLATVNREHGLQIGDAVLREVALRMRLRVREADGLGRAGGDGFLAILPHTDERGAALFADTLRRRIGAREVLTDAGALNITVSIGVTIMRPGMDTSDEDLLSDAHEALRSARAAGGDRIAFDRAHGLARLEEHRRPPSVKDDSARDEA